jgi:hypothetical protein
MLTKSQLEDKIVKNFKIISNLGQTLDLEDIDGVDFRWARCANLEKGYSILIELNQSNLPFYEQNPFEESLLKGNLKMGKTDLIINKHNRRFIHVWCKKRLFKRTFELIAADLIYTLFENIGHIQDPWDILKERIAAWNPLFGNQDGLSDEIGLLGELLTYKLFNEKLGINHNSWTGPKGAPQDFRFNKFNCEVKTTTLRYGYFIKVNGMFQTINRSENDRLIFVRLEQCPSGNLSVFKLISDLRQQMSDVEQAGFDNVLNEYETDLLSSETPYSLLEIKVFNMCDIPKITLESFKGNVLPNGVIELNWKADLANIKMENLDADLYEILRPLL